MELFTSGQRVESRARQEEQEGEEEEGQREKDETWRSRAIATLSSEAPPVQHRWDDTSLSLL